MDPSACPDMMAFPDELFSKGNININIYVSFFFSNYLVAKETV
jgi:hypothetical protein